MNKSGTTEIIFIVVILFFTSKWLNISKQKLRKERSDTFLISYS